MLKDLHSPHHLTSFDLGLLKSHCSVVQNNNLTLSSVLPPLLIPHAQEQNLRTLDNWYTTHCFDADQPLNTWELKETVPSTTPTVRGKLVVVTAPGELQSDVDFMETKLRTVVDENVVKFEHRTLGTADDQLFEVWLESYTHCLLFSKREATYDKDWQGPKDIRDGWEEVVTRVEEEVADGMEVAYEV